jgi:hypothetical protein
LDAKGGPASADIWKSIFWLQQAPGDVSAEAAYGGDRRRAYLSEIQSHVTAASLLYQELTTTPARL